ncbi:MAG TPA: PilZ domain-containing protein [Sandaracinaceae bacterium LLY-WYZ-13_1]|nr:PilZ domain-containing protein [Sandaracinaceae bacterium LLY-WYZ-13_1]
MAEPARAHPRFRAPLVCEVRHAGRVVVGEALDVSETGLRVRAPRGLALGDRVRVSLTLPGSGATVEAQGTVTRRIEGRRAGDDGRSYGIRLTRMDALDRQLLASVACWSEEARGDARATPATSPDGDAHEP